jgi:hypothetical protein
MQYSAEKWIKYFLECPIRLSVVQLNVGVPRALSDCLQKMVGGERKKNIHQDIKNGGGYIKRLTFAEFFCRLSQNFIAVPDANSAYIVRQSLFGLCR